MKQYWVYMMTNRNKTVIYTGVTNALKEEFRNIKTKKAVRLRRGIISICWSIMNHSAVFMMR